MTKVKSMLLFFLILFSSTIVVGVIYHDRKKVGIGTDSPKYPLHINPSNGWKSIRGIIF
jgi:hypothetical protein